ncbi:hypothetical protein OAV62_01895 [bacterium]|nr:hypothetical protein [bacterium]
MSQYKDYTRPTVGQAGCSYSSLGHTYKGHPSNVVPPMSNYMVPDYCPDGPGPNYPPRYDTLTHGGRGSCGGKFDLQGAYPYADCSSCLGKDTGKYSVGNRPSNVPADAFGQFSMRQCASSLVPGCHGEGVVAPEQETAEGFFSFLGL